MKKTGLYFCCILLIIFMCISLIGCKAQKKAIRIGASRSITGPLEIFEKTAFGPIYKMWADEVNASGGIYIKEYNKKLLIELIVYDDKSDLNEMTKNLEKLVTEDKVDILLPPCGTSFLFAAAPIVNKYKYVLIGAEGGASKIKEIITGLPYVFSTLSFSDHNQLPVLADILESLNVKKAAIAFISDLHGIEYSGVAVPQLALKGIDVVLIKSFPIGIKDLSPILKEAKNANVDAFLCFAYPDENILATKQSMEIGFNPKVFLTGPGSNFEFYKQIFGKASEGVMGFGAWNTKVSPEHKELADKIIKLYGEQTLDWWGHDIYYGSLQFLQQAIEKAGTLNQEKLREVVATEKFNTILGQTWFDEKHLLAIECYTGQVGQWQNGIFEVIGPENKSTAKPIYPKPKW